MKTTYDSSYYEFIPHWAAELSDGTTVYQDDINFTDESKSSWIQLKNYVLKNKLNIKNMYVRLRSNIYYPNEPDAEGYFFSKGIVGILTAETIDYYIMGYIKDNKAYLQKIKLPEILPFDYEVRDIKECRDEQIILNSKEFNGETEIRQ